MSFLCKAICCCIQRTQIEEGGYKAVEEEGGYKAVEEEGGYKAVEEVRCDKQYSLSPPPEYKAESLLPHTVRIFKPYGGVAEPAILRFQDEFQAFSRIKALLNVHEKAVDQRAEWHHVLFSDARGVYRYDIEDDANLVRVLKFYLKTSEDAGRKLDVYITYLDEC